MDWKLRPDGTWHRDDGVRLGRAHHDDEGGYVWQATRSLPDPQGRYVVEVEAPNIFKAMDEVDALWPT